MRRRALGIAIVIASGFLLFGCSEKEVTPSATTPITPPPQTTISSQAPTTMAVSEGSTVTTGQPATSSTGLSTTITPPPSVTATGSAPVPDPRLHAPKDGSHEYKAILDALRVPVEQKLQQKVLFVVQGIEVQDGYAFMQGRPVQPDGAHIDYSHTVYSEAVQAGAFDDAVSALLRWRAGSWTVLTYNIGATDVTWLPWASDYGAPEAIFPPRGD